MGLKSLTIKFFSLFSLLSFLSLLSLLSLLSFFSLLSFKLAHQSLLKPVKRGVFYPANVSQHVKLGLIHGATAFLKGQIKIFSKLP